MTPSPEARQILPPSKEALSIAKRLNGYAPDAESYLSIVIDDAIRIDTALAPHRERVRRLVEAARGSAIGLRQWSKDLPPGGSHFRAASAIADTLDAALAPFLEQETTP
jgi:hypothetical protein